MNKEENGEKTKKRASKYSEKDLIAAELLSKVICSYGLGKEFLSDEKFALEKTKEFLKDNKKMKIEDMIVIVLENMSDLEKVKLILKNNPKADDFFYKSFFLSTFSLLEGEINQFLINELEIAKDINFKEANNFIRSSSFDSKFGIILRLLTEQRLDKEKWWSQVKKLKIKRDFFTHIKPEKSKKRDKVGEINKKDLILLIKLVDELDKKLKKIKSNKVKIHERTINKVKKRLLKGKG